jgi:hypothetical protein
METLRYDSQRLDRDSELSSLEYKYKILPLYKSLEGAIYGKGKGEIISVQAVEALRIAGGSGSHILRHSAHR